MNSLSLGAPYLLVVFPLGMAYLFYVYRKGGKPKAVVISSLLVLRQFEGKPTSRTKFKPPLRSLLELLFFLLLALGSAKLARLAEARDVTVIVDNSFSTKARTEGGAPVWDNIKTEAESYLSSLSGSTRIRLYATAPTTHLVSDDSLSPTQARELLKKLQSEYGEDELELLLTKLTQGRTNAETIVFSDKEMAVSRPALSMRTAANLPKYNVAIVEASTTQEKVSVSVVMEGNAPLKTELHLDAIDNDSGGARVIGSDKRELDLTPGAKVVASFDLPKRAKSAKISLPSLPESRNSLKEDDIVWINTSRTPKEITVVSPTGGSLGLDQIPFITVRAKTPEQYDPSSPAGGYIFHRAVPDSLPSTPSLIVLPPPGNRIAPTVTKGGEVKPAQVTRWADSHPITRYLTLTSLAFTEALPLQPVEWSRELISSTAGPIALVGEPLAEKVAVLGFEIFPFDGAKAPTVSILTLNIFKWLFDTSSQGAGIAKASLPLKLGEGIESVRYLETNEAIEKAQDGSFTPPQTGLIVFKGANGYKGQLAVQFFSERESSLVRDPIKLPSLEQKAGGSDYLVEPLSGTLAAIALTLLLLDLYWAALPLRRRGPGSAAR